MGDKQPLDLFDFYKHAFNETVSEELLNVLASHSRIVIKKKGEIVFRPEVASSYSAFLIDGVIKTYGLSTDGTENNYAFYYQIGTPVCMEKDMINIPGVWCKTLTRCKLIELVGPGPYELAEKYPELYPEIEKWYKAFYFGVMEKLRALSTLTAKTRYLWFLEKYAPIVDRISQVEIAMFLGIKPQSLSRIRGELFEEEVAAIENQQ